MRYLLYILFLFSLSISGISQPGNVYYDLKEALKNANDVQTLNLVNKQLTNIPPQIENLRQLEYLYLSENQLTTIPVEIYKLTKLKILDLSINQIRNKMTHT